MHNPTLFLLFNDAGEMNLNKLMGVSADCLEALVTGHMMIFDHLLVTR